MSYDECGSLWVQTNLSNTSTKYSSKEDVDEAVARFFYMDVINVNIANSTHFREMIKSIGEFGIKYEPPVKDRLSGSFLTKEKLRVERVLALRRESWTYTGCTVLCVNRLDATLGCFCVNFFVASPRSGVVFLKEVDIVVGGDDGPDSIFVNELTNVIQETGSSLVVQVITRLGGQASDVFKSVINSKFPNVFWSHCTSHSIYLLMEEIAGLDWMKGVVVRVKQINKCLLAFKDSFFCTSIDIPNLEVNDRVSQKFAPSYYSICLILKMKSFLCELFVTQEWKQWRAAESEFRDEQVWLSGDLWEGAELAVLVYEPFMTILAAVDVDKSIMGDVYNWKILSIEALRGKEIDEMVIKRVEMWVESRWDDLFSPLHAAAYILNPRYFGRGQSKDEGCLMRGWNATIERMEYGGRMREAVGRYWREEGCFGEEDAVDSRDKMDGVSWWDNFGYETPELQSLAVKVLSQIASAGIIMCHDKWEFGESMGGCRESVERSGLEADEAEDLVFVRNNLKLQNIKYATSTTKA